MKKHSGKKLPLFLIFFAGTVDKSPQIWYNNK